MSKSWHDACGEILGAARGAAVWVNDAANHETVGLERKSIDKRLRRMISEATKLDRSVDRPMCVGVFGPSQAGKSYLVSVLASASGRPLLARFKGIAEPLDFLRDINPIGEGESTGVVTRFSMSDRPSPEGFPVCLRLLSESDVVKILGNSFFLDGDQKKLPAPEPQALNALLASARERAARERPDDNMLTVEDVWDIQDYFERTFDGTHAIEALRIYWDEAAELAPKLSLPDRMQLFAPLWGSLDELTGLYGDLTRALASLGFAKDAYCSVDALVPRETTIVDVANLKGLGKPDQPTLRIRSYSGAVVALPRAVVTALVAELHVTMVEQPWPFFARTDLLDFPGARNRETRDLKEYLASATDPLKELVLRGKVAYLFERYVAEQELTSMLLCIKHSNQDVVSLPAMISSWIAVSHGATPEARRGKTIVLFLILTMFDTHFVETGGENREDTGAKFRARLDTSITNFLGNTYDWSRHWTPEGAFQNTYWMRNPKYPAESIIVYDEARNETGYRDDKVDYIRRLRDGYLDVPAVHTYFKEPARAFDEALKLNDGGIGYLAANLEPVCRADLKDEQIAGRIASLREQIFGLVSPFHVGDDVEKRLDERRAVSYRILRHVQRLGSEGRFADLLMALQMSQHAFTGVLYDYYTRNAQAGTKVRREGVDAPSAPSRPSVAAAMPSLPGMPPLPGLPPLPSMATAKSEAAPTASRVAARHDPLSMSLARTAIEHWMNVLRSNAESDTLADFFENDAALALELVTELSNAARRTRLEETLLAVIERLGGSIGEEMDITLEKAAFAASMIVNRFATRFYFDAVATVDRPSAPTSDGRSAPIFTRPPAANSAREIALDRSLHGYDALSHWMHGFHTMVEENAKSIDGLTFDVEQNARLGAILRLLGRAASDAGGAA